jgi:ribosome-associated protein
MPDDLRVNSWLVIPAGDLHERFSRSSGPGGQGVNTADTRVELSFDIARSPALPEYARVRALDNLRGRVSEDGVLTVVASEQRSQLLNRRAARGRMANLIREAIAPPPAARVPTRPSRRARERRVTDKRRRGEIKRNRQVRPGEE